MVPTIAVTALLGFGAGHSLAAPAYTVLDLASFAGDHSEAKGFGAVNASGQVVGFSYFNPNAGAAFRTAANAAIDPVASNLGTATGAYAINASGQVAGALGPAGGPSQASRASATGKLDDPAALLGSLGGSECAGFGINDSGQVVGYSSLAVGTPGWHAFRTTATGKVSDANTDLSTLGGTSSYAYGINASGQTVGSSDLAGNLLRHAYRTTATGKVSSGNTDLGTLGGKKSAAFGINASGQTVGTSNVAGDLEFHAFRTTATGKVSGAGADLGTLGGSESQAVSINTAGQVVGFANLVPSGATYHAIFCDVSGPMRDLNALIPAGGGWVLNEAHGINDRGQIAGFGTVGGKTHAFLLTPARGGDATGDGLVDFSDLVILAQNYNMTDGKRTWWTGDFTGDGNVDFNDLVQLAQNYNVPPGAASASPASLATDFGIAMASVPEPGAAAAAACLAIAGMLRRNRG